MIKPNRPQLLRTLIAAATLPLAALFAPGAFAIETRNTDFAQVLPASGTDAVFVVDNFFKYARFDEKSPMARLLANPAVDSWITDLMPGQMTYLRDRLDLSAKETARLFSGKAAVAIMLKQPDTAKPAAVTAELTPSKEEKEINGQKAQIFTYKKTVRSDENALEYDKLVLVEFQGSPSEYEELADKLDAGAKRMFPSVDIKREQVEGVGLRSLEITLTNPSMPTSSITTYRALYEGTIILSTNRGVLLDTIHNLARGAATEPLSGQSAYLADKKEMGNADGFFFMNLGVAAPKLRDFLINMVAARAMPNLPPEVQSALGQMPQGLMGLMDPKLLVDALATGNFTSLYGAVTISEQDVEARYGLTWKDQVGLASLIKFGSSPVTIPAFASGDYKGIDVTTADYRAAWEAVDHLVQTAMPTFNPMLLVKMTNQSGVGGLLSSLRKDMLDNLDGELVSLTGFSSATPPDDEVPSKAVVMKIKDPAAMQAGIAAMAELATHFPGGSGASKFEPQDYLGVKIYKLPRPMTIAPRTIVLDQNPDGSMPAMPDIDALVRTIGMQVDYVFYAVVENHLVVGVGTDAFVKGVVANVQKPSRAGVVGKFKEALGDIPGIPCSLSYGDVATYLMASTNAALLANVYRTAKPIHDDLLKARAAARDLHYFWTGKSYASSNGLFGRLTVSEDHTAAD